LHAEAQRRRTVIDRQDDRADRGNEDGAHQVTAALLQALNDTGWTAPAQAACYWVGEAMHKTDFKDLRQVPENVQALAGILAANAVHLANLLQQEPYPGVAPSR